MRNHARSLSDTMSILKQVYDRMQSNDLVRHSLGKTEMPAGVYARVTGFHDTHPGSLQTSQDVLAVYDHVEDLVGYCRALKEHVLDALRRAATASRVSSQTDDRTRLLLDLSLQSVPIAVKELTDCLTDLWVSAYRRDVEIHGETRTLAARYPSIPGGLRELCRLTADT